MSAPALILRDDQSAVVADVRARFAAGASSVALCAPTGWGKTVAFSYIVQAASAKGKRVLILAHRIEILEQISKALTAFGVAHGLINPGAPLTDHNVQVASVATIARRLDYWRARFDFIVIDECHHAVAGSWARVIASQPEAKILGVTATPQRLDGKGLGDVFQQLVLAPSVKELIARGRLSSFVAYAADVQIDVSGVKTRGGDFAVEGLREAAMDGVVISAAVDEYLRLCDGASAIAFCVDIAHSQAVATAFGERGLQAEHVDGETPSADRKRLIAALGTGEIDVLCNCGLISEGVDVPAVGAAILLRPTKSLALYLQQVGRVLRMASGKERAILLDFASNCVRHGLPDEPREWSLDSKARRAGNSQPPPVRRCAECGALAPIAAHTCPECGADLLTRKERAEIAVRLREADEAFVAERLRNMSYPERLRWAEGDEEKLRKVAAACSYKRGWIFHRLQELSAEGCQ